MIKSIFIFTFTLATNLAAFAQQNNYQNEGRNFIGLLERTHYHPRIINDSFSEEVFHEFIKSLDSKGVYFTQADIQSIQKFKYLIDNDLKTNSWIVLPAISKLYQQKLLAAEKIITEILSKPLNYTTDETISFADAKDSITFAANEKTLTQRWTKLLKYDVLYRMINYYDEKNQNEKEFLLKESEIREKVKSIQIRAIKRILEHHGGVEKYISTLFFNSIASRYDPHTYYLSTTEWQNLESSISTEGYSFGLELEESETGDISISGLTPGGPAWKSNELHKGDIVTGLKWEGKEPIELTGADVSEVYSILKTSNNSKLEVTVRRNNGQVKTVSLKKEKIKEEENVVKSFILKAAEMHIGYISLPGFYSEWDVSSGKGCSNDVAKEIIKLQKEHIDGLILDLRNNGGGPVIEGLNLAGIFIDQGPLFMMKTKEEKPLVMKDLNRGTIYDGPLIVMVNGLSASASEIVASTLQDYHRAVIVGTNTYGKATAQRITPIDTNIQSINDTKIMNSLFGATGITFAKLYRVSGASCQLKGIVPDVHLPDMYEKMNFGERSYPLALPNDSISKKLYYSPLPPLPVNELSSKSLQRINVSEKFNQIKEQGKKYNDILNQMQKIPLTYEGFKKKHEEIEQWWSSQQETEEEKSDFFTVDNVDYDKELLNMDAYSKEVNDEIIKSLQQDIYLEETFRIITDLINLNATRK